MDKLAPIIEFLADNPMIPIIGLTGILVLLRLAGIGKSGVTWLFIAVFVVAGLAASTVYN